MRKKFVAAVAAFAALCGMVSVPANAAETTQPIREDVTPHVLVPIPVPESKLVSEPVQAAPVVSQSVQSAPAQSVPQAAPRSYTFEDVYNLAVNSPYCELEDGSDLPQCYWHDGAGDGSEPPYTDIVYMPDGYGYQAHEDTMTVSVFARNPWL